MLKRNYDTVAAVYDKLSQAVFKKKLINAQLFLLQSISDKASILIAGGGTGWILEAITQVRSSGLSITYIDASPKMIALARKRYTGENKVTFITGRIEQMVLSEQYDTIITPFFFDNFLQMTCNKIFLSLHKQLKSKGNWLYCDFRNTNIWKQKILLKIMYLFFRTFCGVEATQLPDVGACFNQNGYNLISEKTFAADFISSRVYRKD